MAIEQWGFFSVPHLLWHGTFVYNDHHRGRLGFSTSNNISTPRSLFYNNHENKYFISIIPLHKFSSKEERCRPIFDVKLKQPFPVTPSWFKTCKRLVFILKSNRCYSFNLMCECLYDILIKLWPIIIINNLFLWTMRETNLEQQRFTLIWFLTR